VFSEKTRMDTPANWPGAPGRYLETLKWFAKPFLPDISDEASFHPRQNVMLSETSRAKKAGGSSSEVDLMLESDH
jgi:hypothetical protein